MHIYITVVALVQRPLATAFETIMSPHLFKCDFNIFLYPLCKVGWVGEHGCSTSVWPLQTRGKCSVDWDETPSLSSCTLFFQIRPLSPSQEPSWLQGMRPCWNLRWGDRLLFLMQIRKYSCHVSSSACKKLKCNIWQIFKIKLTFRTLQSNLLQYSQPRSPSLQPICPSV